MSSQTTITYANASGAAVTLEATTGTVATIGNQRITDGAAHYMPTMDVVARAGVQELTDGTNGPVAVKAPSTAAVAADPALVVALSPNNTGLAAMTSGVGTASTNSDLVAAVFYAWASLPAPTGGQQTTLVADEKGSLHTCVLPPGVPIYNGASAGATQNVATLTIPSAKMGYIDGFDLDGLGATAGTAIAVTVAGLLGGTLTFEVGIPAGVTVPFTLQRRFSPPLQASAIATNIVVTVPSYGTGNTAASVNAFGHYI